MGEEPRLTRVLQPSGKNVPSLSTSLFSVLWVYYGMLKGEFSLNFLI